MAQRSEYAPHDNGNRAARVRALWNGVVVVAVALGSAASAFYIRSEVLGATLPFQYVTREDFDAAQRDAAAERAGIREALAGIAANLARVERLEAKVDRLLERTP